MSEDRQHGPVRVGLLGGGTVGRGTVGRGTVGRGTVGLGVEQFLSHHQQALAVRVGAPFEVRHRLVRDREKAGAKRLDRRWLTTVREASQEVATRSPPHGTPRLLRIEDV